MGFGSIVSWSRTGSRAMSSSPPRSRCPGVIGAPRPMRSMARCCGTLAAFKRGETRVCSMVVPPTPAEEDRRRLSGERRTLIKEQVEHGNRIRGLLASQGIRHYRPLRRDCRERLAALHTGDGHPLPPRLTAEILCELDRLELVRQQLAEVEAARDALLKSQEGKAPVKLLLRLTGIGPEFATVLWLEGLFRGFSNRRQLAACAGLAPSPWRSGRIDREQGISKAGNPRLRTTMIELAWSAREAGQDRRQDRAPRPLRRVPAGRGGDAESAVRRDPAPDRLAQAEAAPHMTAWRSTPGSAQERCAPSALVNGLDGSAGTFAVAETQPGGLAPPFHAAMTC